MAIQSFDEVQDAHATNALMSTHERWQLTPQLFWQSDSMFHVASTRTHLYIDSLRRNGTKWLGLRFHFPLLWCALNNYRSVQHWNEFEEIATWVEVECCLR
jgi:hypothetical protein